MSSIIEQAILDATQLREAALKTAENQIIEKYSSEIKEAMSSILDEDEEEMAVADIADEEGAMADEAPENVQQASMSVTKMCPCPDPEEGEESVFVFNLDDLQAANDGDEAEDAAETQGDLLDAVAGEIAEVLNLDEAAEEVEETKCNSKGDHSHSLEEEEVEVAEALGGGFNAADSKAIGDEELPQDEDEDDQDDLSDLEEAEISIDPEMIKDLVQEMVVDIGNAPGEGWAGRPEAYRQEQEKINLARLADEDEAQELEDLKAGMEDLAGLKESLEAQNSVLAQTVTALKEKLEQLTVVNAKLALQNEVLVNESLNGRQKNRIVESINKAESAKDAKVIAEALQSSVDAPASTVSKGMESLNEAISRPSHVVPRREISSKSGESELKNRFQRLAGIKRN
jgi:hypothetical protein